MICVRDIAKIYDTKQTPSRVSLHLECDNLQWVWPDRTEILAGLKYHVPKQLPFAHC